MARQSAFCDICNARLRHFEKLPSKHKLCGPAGDNCRVIDTSLTTKRLESFYRGFKLCKAPQELYSIPMPLCARTHFFVLLANLPPGSLGTNLRRLKRAGMQTLLGIYGIRLYSVVYLGSYREALLEFRDGDEAKLAAFLLNKDGGYVFADALDSSNHFEIHARLLEEDEQLRFALRRSRCGSGLEQPPPPPMRHPAQEVRLWSKPWRVTRPILKRGPVGQPIYLVDWKASIWDLRRYYANPRNRSWRATAMEDRDDMSDSDDGWEDEVGLWPSSCCTERMRTVAHYPGSGCPGQASRRCSR